MTTTELYAFLRKAMNEDILQDGDTIKIENDKIYWSNDGGCTWEECE